MRLVPWGEGHSELLVRLAAMPEVMRWIGSGRIWPPQLAEEVAAAASDHWAEHGFGWRAAVGKEAGRPIGLMALNLVGEGVAGLDPCEHEIGWWLEPAVWGQGFAREGGEALCREAFGSVGATSVVARIQPGNRRSIGVAERLGLGPDFETTGADGEAVSVYRLVAADRRSSSRRPKLECGDPAT